MGTNKVDEEGFGLLASILALLIISVLGTTLVTVTMTDLAVASHFQTRAAAFYAADSGIQQTVVDLASDESWVASLLAGATLGATPDTLTINGNSVSIVIPDGAVDPVPGYYPMGSESSIGAAHFTREIYFPLPPVEMAGPTVWVTLPVRVSGIHGAEDPSTSVIGADVRVRVDPSAGPWAYALAVGDGWGSEAIDNAQDTLQVRGSLRVFGDRVDPPQVIWRGQAALMNHYAGLDNSSRFGSEAVKLPPLDTVVVNGETVETLHAIVNIEDADFLFMGEAAWGEPDIVGNNVKETLDGIYVDGRLEMTGSGGQHGDERGPFLDDKTAFPSLNDPYVDPATGASYATHQGFLDSESLTLPYESIGPDTPAFDLSDASGNRIAWDPATATLDVEGLVRRPGDLLLGLTEETAPALIDVTGPDALLEPASPDSLIGPESPDSFIESEDKKDGDVSYKITYMGTGTIYATDDLGIGSDLLPAGQYLDRDSLGLIAGHTMHIGGQGRIRVIAAAYAGVRAVVAKASHLAGSLVAGSVGFDADDGGGTIAHVPKLGLAPPPGMPGSGTGGFAIIEVQIRDWQEIR